MPFSNQEKQDRFRRKENLYKEAKDLFIKWQLLHGFDQSRSPAEVKAQLEKIVDLPSGWTDENYNAAQEKLKLFENDFFSNNPHLLENDIWNGRKQNQSTAESINDGKKAIANAQINIQLILSSFELSKNRNSDNAAIVMELARRIGSALLSDAIDGNIPQSDATAICFLLTNSMLPKPTWLLEAIAKILKQQLQKPESRTKLAQMLLDSKESTPAEQ